MSFTNCKVTLKLKWKKYCVFPAAGVGNTTADLYNVNFTIKSTELYVPLVTLLAKDNKKLSTFLRATLYCVTFLVFSLRV